LAVTIPPHYKNLLFRFTTISLWERNARNAFYPSKSLLYDDFRQPCTLNHAVCMFSTVLMEAKLLTAEFRRTYQVPVITKYCMKSYLQIV